MQYLHFVNDNDNNDNNNNNKKKKQKKNPAEVNCLNKLIF